MQPPSIDTDLAAALKAGDDEPIDLEIAVEQIVADASLNQLLLRHETAGVESITIYQRINFEPNQKTAVVHLPFSPVLASIPNIEGSFIDGTEARLRITDCQCYGARIEVILSQSQADSLSRVLVLNIV